MKATIISVSVAALLCALVLAQNVVPPARVVNPAPVTEPAPAWNEAPRFNLNFPGGKVREFVAAVTKALGKPVNVIIPKEAEATTIPPVDVFSVTVSALFEALSSASKRQVLVQGVNAKEWREVGFVFLSQENGDSPEKVWTFEAITPPELRAEVPTTPQRVVQYYPVAEYLAHFTVEDITTAIESGWKLQGGESAKDPAPVLRFHEETKLLICAGSNQQLDIIPQVLAGLGQSSSYSRTDDLKITRKAAGITVGRIEFREASVSEAIDFIRKKALESDPEKKGINILLNEVNGPADRRLTLSLTEIPILDLLRFIAELAELDLQIRDNAIVLRTGVKPNSPDAAPPDAGHGGLPFPGPASPNPAAGASRGGGATNAQNPATASFPGGR